jgi:YD repeat-containing protein
MPLGRMQLRLVWPVVLALHGCSSRGTPVPVVANEHRTARPRLANDCPYFLLGPWSRELFPACLPWFFGADLPICAGAACAGPCASRFAGDAGDIRIDAAMTYRYDTRGRFLAVVVDGTPKRSCTYDGDLLSSCMYGDRPLSVTRDARGRIATLKDEWGAINDIKYDDAGRVIAVGRTTLRYDGAGWLTDVGDKPVVHDAEGHMMSMGTGKDAWTYAYDGDRLVELTTDLTSATFDYDALGRLHRLHSVGRRGTSDTETVYQYDCH